MENVKAIDICKVSIIETFDGGNRVKTLDTKRRNDMLKFFLRKGVPNEEFGHHFNMDFAETQTPDILHQEDRIEKVLRHPGKKLGFIFHNSPDKEYIWDYSKSGFKL